MKYKYSGTLYLDDPTYVVRQADCELREGLEAGEFCYVLSPRQTGKSSLRVRTMKQLKESGVACAAIDLSLESVNEIKPSEWYAGLISFLVRQFNMNFDMNSWYKLQDWSSPLNRFHDFIESVLLTQIEENIVIFIDEIDSVISLPFSVDDFFVFIRACYNKRADQPIYKRLTFCLLGVATPSDLIRDKKRTPFNIGRAVELTRFKLSEAKESLTDGLAQKFVNPEQILREVLEWTGGQPFLTQKVCQLVLNTAESINPDIRRIVQTYVINGWESQDSPEHLITIRNRLLADEKLAGRMLGLYDEILISNSISADMSEEKMQLRLSGLVVKENEKLLVYNPIYKEIFNRDWIADKLAELRPSDYVSAFDAWVKSDQSDSLLLKGKALFEALGWKDGRSLSLQDQEFIVRSQELARREAEQANQILEEANQKAEQANQTLKEANQKAGQRIAFGSVVLGTTLVGSAIVAWGAFVANEARVKAENKSTEVSIRAIKEEVRANKAETKAIDTEVRESRANKKLTQTSAKLTRTQDYLKAAQDKLEFSQSNLKTSQQQLTSTQVQLASTEQQRQVADKDLNKARKGTKQAQQDLKLAQEGSQLERIGGRAVQQFESGDEIQALLTAMEVGQELKKLIAKNKLSRLEDYPSTGPILALQTILDKVHETSLEGYHGELSQLTVSSDSERILTVSKDSIAKLWNRSGGLISQLSNQQQISRADFSPNSRLLVTRSHNGVVKLLTSSGKEIAQLTGNKGVYWPDFSPNSNFLAVRDQDGTTVWLLNVTTGKITKLIGKEKVEFIEFSPDSNILLVTTGNRRTLWRLSDGQLTDFSGSQGITTSKFSPNGRDLAAIDKDGTTVWLLNTASSGGAKLTGERKVKSIEFSPDSRLIAVNDEDERVWLQNLSTGESISFVGNKAISSSTNSSELNSSLRFNSDSSQLVARGEDINTIRVLNTASMKFTRTLEGKKIKSYQFIPGKNLLIMNDDDGSWLWDTLSGNLRQLASSKDIQREVWIPSNSPFIAGYGVDDSLSLWNFSGDRVFRLPDHRGGLHYITVAFSFDRKLLATSDRRGVVRVWNTSGQLLNTLQGPRKDVGTSYKLAFSQGGNNLIAAAMFNAFRKPELKLWNLSNNSDNPESQAKLGNTSQMEVSSDGSLVAAEYSNSVILIADLYKNEMLDGSSVYAYLIKNGKIAFPLLSMKFSPKGQKFIVTEAFTSFATLIDIVESKRSSPKTAESIVKNFSRHKSFVVNEAGGSFGYEKAIFSPDEKLVAISSRDSGILREVIGQELYRFESLSAERDSIKFSSNSKLVAALDQKSTVIVLNVDSKRVARITETQNKIVNFEFSRDSKLLATLDKSGSVKVWDTSGKQVAKLSKQSGRYSTIAFSSDNVLATGEDDGTITLWDTSGKELRQLKGHEHKVIYAAFSPNGKRLVTRDQNGTFRMWETNGKSLGEIKGIKGFVDVEINSDNSLLLLRSSSSSEVTGTRIASAEQGFGEDRSAPTWEGETSIYDMLGRQTHQFIGVGYTNWEKIAVFKRNPSGETVVSVHTIDNLDKLLARGCGHLKGYLINNPERLEKLQVCQNSTIKKEAAQALAMQGGELAQAGDVQGAIVKFREAQAWNSDLNFNIETEAQRLATPSFAKEMLARGEQLAQAGKVIEAIAAYAEAQKLDPTLKVSIKDWKTLCSYGIQHGYTSKVMYACENATKLDPKYAPAVTIGLILENDSNTKVLVKGFLPNSPAQKAGLQPGDLILQVDNQLVSTSDDVVALTRKRRAGERVRIEFKRKEQKKAVEVVTEIRFFEQLQQSPTILSPKP